MVTNYPSWGKCTVKIAPITDGSAGEEKTLPIPKEGSTKFIPGNKKELKIEGGKTYASIQQYQFETAIFVDSSVKLETLFGAKGGVIGDHKITVEPANKAKELGLEINSASLEVSVSFDPSTEGYTATITGLTDFGNAEDLFQFVQPSSSEV